MRKRYLFFTVICCIAAIFARGQDSAFLLQLTSGHFIPAPNATSYIKDKGTLQRECVNGLFYRYLQFYTIPGEEEKKAIEQAGIQLLGYIPNNTYIAAIPLSFDLASLPSLGLRSVLDISPVFKMSPAIISADYPEWCLKANNNIALFIKSYCNIPAEGVKKLLRDENIIVQNSIDASCLFEVQIPIADIQKMTSLPYISWVEPIPPPPVPENYFGAAYTKSNTLNSPLLSGRKYDGAGMTVSIGDYGKIGPHIDLDGKIIKNATTDDAGHEDHTSGIFVGAGNLDPRYHGMAPKADILVYANSATVWGPVANAVADYTNNNVRVTSQSWSDDCKAGYNALAQTVDQQSRQMPYLLHVFSAGNIGTTNCGFLNNYGNISGGIKTGKNVLAIGNTDFLDTLHNLSSRGPAKDGRIKPEVCAMGTNVYSTHPNNTYGYRTGTSMSSPMAAGIAAQLMQAHKELNSGKEAHSALIRAAIMNSADDLGNPGPDFKFGFGRINALEAVKILENKFYLLDSVSQGDNNQHTINVPTGTKILKVMLHWTDFEAAPGASAALVNNLDISIKDPSNNNFQPWILSSTTSTVTNPATRGTDNVNNTEQITITNPAAGIYTLNINGKSIPQGPQPYYIVYQLVEDIITVTYPYGGESMVPGETEHITWQAPENTGTFDIYFSGNGGTGWKKIGSGIPAKSRVFEWTVPNELTGQGLIKVERGGQSGINNKPFSIMDVPSPLNVSWSCASSFKIEWPAVPGAKYYEVYKMGSKYMQLEDTTSNTFYIFKNGISSANSYWVSVKAVGNGMQSRRSVATQKQAGIFNCPSNTDVAVTVLLIPAAGSVMQCQNLSSVKIKVVVENKGLQTISGINTGYKINTKTPLIESFPGNLMPGEKREHVFSAPEDLSAAGTYTIKVWSTIAGDGNKQNDTLKSITKVVSGTSATFPFKEDFEGFTICTASACSTTCSTKNGWINETNGSLDDADWRGDDNGTSTGNTGPDIDHTKGTSTGKYIFLESSSCTAKTALITSPCISLPANSSPLLSLWYHLYGSTMGELHISVIANGELFPDIIYPVSGDRGNEWKTANISLAGFAGKNIQLQLKGITGNGDKSDMAIDDIMIADATGAKSSISDYSNYKIYPNPTKGLFNVELQTELKEPSNISVIDIQGRILQKRTACLNKSDKSVIIDLNGYSSGTYILVIEDKSGVFRAIIHKQE